MSDIKPELVNGTQQVVKILKKAAIEEQTVEIQINRRTRIFFTNLMDHPPELVDATTGSGGKVLVEPAYTPFSYLDHASHLLLAPLYPAVGNAYVRSSTEMLIRFFDGVKSYEKTLFFSSAPFVRGEPAIALSFPDNLLLFRRRRFFRADLPANIQLKLSIQVGIEAPARVRLMNISPGGLAFCGAMPPETLPMDGPVMLLLEGPDGPALRVSGIVRSYARTTPKENCPEFPHRYGVQYDVVSEQMAMRIGEMSAYAQRIHLHRTLALRAKFDVLESQPVQEKPIPREEKVVDLMRFFGIKRDQKP